MFINMVLRIFFILKICVCIFLDISYQYFFGDLNPNPWWPLGVYFSFSWHRTAKYNK
jgi:hypothetical protein